jgi:hypothetical protein
VTGHGAAWIKDTEGNLLVIVQLPVGKKVMPRILAEGRATGELTGYENHAAE